MVYAGVILILVIVLNFFGIAGATYLVTNYLFPLFGIGIVFSWELVFGVFGAIILLKIILNNSTHSKS